MSDSFDKYAKLADRLFDLTSEKKLEWNIDPFDEEVTCRFSSHKIIISDGRDSEGSPYVQISIRSLSDVEIDTFTDNDLSGRTPDRFGYENYWKLMSGLLRTARRQAKGADEAIDSILGELDDKDLPF